MPAQKLKIVDKIEASPVATSGVLSLEFQGVCKSYGSGAGATRC